MDGDNKVFCDVCESKQDTWIGTKIKSFPQVLIFTLSRFSFNYETF
jgi:ubiquitin C-terminal hydrolase